MTRRLLILTYHRVPRVPDPLMPGEVERETFDRQMSVVAKAFNVVPLVPASSQLRDGTLPPRAVAITFDDGYRDNYTVALPILQKYGLSATFFITTGSLDAGRMWNDTVIEVIRGAGKGELDWREVDLGRWPIRNTAEKRSAIGTVLKNLKYRPFDERMAAVEYIQESASHELPDDLMMTSRQVGELAGAGMEIGAHTVNHPILGRISDEQAEWEIYTSKKELEALTGSEVRAFAYPNGRPQVDYDDRHVELVRKQGFGCAVSTRSGFAQPSDDVLQYPRLAPWHRSRWKFLLRYLHGFWR